MIELVNTLNKATEAYDLGKPIMSDKEWDDLYFKLVQLEKENGYALPHSPTQQIQFTKRTEFQKVEHNHPMLSLDKTKDWEEFKNYFRRIDSTKDVVCMLKLDGLSCSLRYVGGWLVSAETRGDGKIGELVTDNALTAKGVPRRINYKEELIIDGEIICTYKDFEKYKDDYKNPRNFAAGAIRLLDSEECAARSLTFVCWNIIKGFPQTNSFIDKLEKAEQLGFLTTPYVSTLGLDAKDFLTNEAKELGYPIDGLVGRFDDIEFAESLKETAHHPTNAYAFKFYDEEYETTLIDIEWSFGRNGTLTPVAVFEPVEISGTECGKASLHNLSVMDELNGGFARRGDRIWVFKANDIIPQISAWEHIGNFKQEDSLLLPEICPVCGEQTKIVTSSSGTRTLVCGNDNCSSKFINQLEYFCGKSGLDIKGLGRSTLDKLVELGWIESFEDVFNLHSRRSEWVKLPGFGSKSVDNTLAAIEASKECEFPTFISALGIPLIGTTVAKDLTKHLPTWEEFISAVEDPNYRFYNLPSFGVEKHYSIKNYDYTTAKKLAKILKILYNNNTVSEENKNVKDKVFVITGSLKEFKNRDELKKLIENLGGKVSSSVSSKTDYLINNDIESSSSKNLSAKKLNIPIISENKFFEIIKNL